MIQNFLKNDFTYDKVFISNPQTNELQQKLKRQMHEKDYFSDICDDRMKETYKIYRPLDMPSKEQIT